MKAPIIFSFVLGPPSLMNLTGVFASLALAANSFAQQIASPEGKSPVALPPSDKPVVSPGLLNEWLRQQSGDFSPWDIGGQFRLRYEVKEDGGSSGGAFPNVDFRRTGVDNDNSFLLLREKLHVGFTPASWFTLYAEGRDSSSTWDDRHPSPEGDFIDLHQAFLRIGDATQSPVTVKVGRQELIYGDERLVGNADWANIPRSFDAAKVRFEDPNFWVDGFVGRVVLPVNHQFNLPNDFDWFSGIYASTATLVPKQETQLYFLSRNASEKAATTRPGALYGRPASARNIYTVGTRVKSLPGQWRGWDYAAEIAAQFGGSKLNVPGVGPRRLDHEALAASAGAGYTWTSAFGTPRLGLEYNFASGDHDPKDGKDETFENLFPTNHKHYGYMDFMGWRNIHNPRLSAALKPAKPLLLSLDYHLFWLADTHDFFYPEAGPGRSVGGYGRNPQFNSFVGSEIDLEAVCTLRPWIILRVGYGHFFVGDYIKSSLAKVGGATDADWVYLQTTFNL